MYFSKSQIKGASVLQKVSSSDEWCAEAYMETDYSALTEKDYMKFVKNYVLFKISNEQ